MKQARRWVLMLLLVPCLLSAPALAGGDVNLLYGQKALSDDLLQEAGVDLQTEWGVQVSLDFDWPVALAVDLLSSDDDSTIAVPAAFPTEFKTDVSTFELDVGVRKFWFERARPYVGAGIGWMKLSATQAEWTDFGDGAVQTAMIIDDSDSGIGFWLGGGFLYTIGEHFNIGIDLRYSDSSATLRPVSADDTLDLDTGGMHYTLALGYHW